MRNLFAALLLAVALPALAAQTATTTRTAELRASPTVDGQALKTLPPSASVEVLKRVGGWYQVRTSEGVSGWVRMWLIRFAPAPKENVAVLQSGRSTSTYTTATTGVRGLSEEELQNAKPNPAAVATLEQFVVAEDDARAFAQQGALKAGEPKEAP